MKTENTNGKLLTMGQVAERLNVSRGWLYKKIQAGIIPHFKIGGMVRFDPKDLDEWLSGHKVRGALKV
jgi:excisionase family DNA binding protein